MKEAPTKRGRPNGTTGIPWKRRAVSEVRLYQTGARATEMLLSKAPFVRLLFELVRLLATEAADGEPPRFTREAVKCLMHAAEAFLVELFLEASRYTLHAKRVTMLAHNIALAKRYFGLPSNEQLKANAAADDAADAAAATAADATEWMESLAPEDPDNPAASPSLIGDKKMLYIYLYLYYTQYLCVCKGGGAPTEGSRWSAIGRFYFRGCLQIGRTYNREGVLQIQISFDSYSVIRSSLSWIF